MAYISLSLLFPSLISNLIPHAVGNKFMSYLRNVLYDNGSGMNAEYFQFKAENCKQQKKKNCQRMKNRTRRVIPHCWKLSISMSCWGCEDAKRWERKEKKKLVTLLTKISRIRLFVYFFIWKLKSFFIQQTYPIPSLIQIPDFWCPLKLTDVDGSIKIWDLPKARYDFLLKNSAGLRFEAEEVRQLINEGLLESPSVAHEESLRIVRVQDKLRSLLGVHFPEDDLEY